MRNKRYYLFCLLSGCLWALVAYVLWPSSATGEKIVWGEIVTSPVIGLIVGLCYYPAYKFNLFGRIFTSLATLYIGGLLFGLSVGIYDMFAHMFVSVQYGASPNLMAIVLQDVNGALWGLTFTGYFLLLWPLAFLNHWLIGRIAIVS